MERVKVCNHKSIIDFLNMFPKKLDFLVLFYLCL